jgi:hypothetical protein
LPCPCQARVLSILFIIQSRYDPSLVLSGSCPALVLPETGRSFVHWELTLYGTSLACTGRRACVVLKAKAPSTKCVGQALLQPPLGLGCGVGVGHTTAFAHHSCRGFWENRTDHTTGFGQRKNLDCTVFLYFISTQTQRTSAFDFVALRVMCTRAASLCRSFVHGEP